MTIRGYWALTFAILCGLGSISFASKFLLLFCVFIVSLILISCINVFFVKSNIHINRQITPQKAYEENDVLVNLEIKGAAADTIIKDYFDDGRRSAKFFFDKNSKHAVSNAQYKFHVDNRGVYKLGPVLVTESDWLGFFSKNRIKENDEKLFVYPKIELIPLPKSPLQYSDEASYFDMNSSTVSEDLFGLKEYTPGDDIRLIHWKTSSHTQKLFVRHHEPIATRSMAIILDLNLGSYLEDELEPAIRLAASMCQAASSSEKNCIYLLSDTAEEIPTSDDFQNRLCSATLSLETIPLQSLANNIAKDQRDTFIITGSKSSFAPGNCTVFRVNQKTKFERSTANIIDVGTSTVFEDYRQQVELWNAQETSASL